MKCLISISSIAIFTLATLHEPTNDDSDNSEQELATVYSSCNSIEQNGLYYIKPMENGPILPAICNNGYTMIDGSLDTEMNILPSFLSSWDYGRSTWYIFSRLDDLSTWREWFLPSDENTKFRVAVGCEECIDGQFPDNTVYYTDSHSYCFSDIPSSGCIEDTTSYYYHPESCNQCDVGSFDETGQWTSCSNLQMSADQEINHDHLQCVAHGLTFHPVISHMRDACTCYQPQETEGTITYQVPIEELPTISWAILDPNDFSLAYDEYNIDYIDPNMKFSTADPSNYHPITDFRDSNVVHLYNSDFEQGTYRILESGTYIIEEDIVFNFNPPSDEEMGMDGFSPNSIDVDELYWYPTMEQASGDSTHPGLYRYEGAYALGFFAGITVEADYVTIDLNGHTLSQDYGFYFQQRFFSLIELSSMYFLPGQGPANWGPTIISGNHVEIMNGNLGLTSHHGIHGNGNQYVTISNVNSGDFDVAGMQCNACNNVVISDCIIGPQNQNIPVLGRYAHARSFVPRLKQLVVEHGDEMITFHDRDPVSVESLVDRLINQMDMIYFNAINDVEYDEDDEEWIAAKQLFYNPSGWMDGGSSYGLVIGGNGAQVVGIGSRSLGTRDVTLNNLEIYGIGNKLVEKIKFADGDGATRLMFFDAIDWVAVSDQVDDPSQSRYTGDAYTDCIFAVDQVITSWYYLNSLYINSAEEAYVFDGDSDAFANEIFGTDNEKFPNIGGCGTDIQLHSSKGAIGLRIDGVQGLNVDNVYVHDIYNWADLGNQEWCGEYNGPSVGGEDPEIQYGFTGTRSHGMIIDYATGSLSNILIENVESWHGEANGLTVYKGCDITLESIQVDNIHAGTQLNDEDVDMLSLPNLTPRACGVDIRADTLVEISDDNGIINGDDIIGFETCYDDGIEEDLSRFGKFGFGFGLNKSHVSVMVVLLIVFMSLVFIKAIMKRSRYNDDGYYKSVNIEDSYNYNEFSPLL